MSATSAQQPQAEVTVDQALNLARGHHRMGNLVLAERTYRDILRAVKDSFEANHFLGILLFQTDRAADSIPYFKNAIKINADDHMVWNNYASVLTQVKDYNEALDCFNRALSIDPDYIDAMNNKAHVLTKLDRHKEAEVVAKKALEIEENHPLAMSHLAVALSEQEQYAEAIELWEALSELHPEDAMVWSNWANTLREMGRVSAAEEPCRKAVELNPENIEALNNLANILRDLGQAQEAIDLYTEATNFSPEYYTAHNNRSMACFDIGRFKDAAVSARYAIAFKSDFSRAYGNLSRALVRLGELDKAYMAAQKQVSLDSESPDAWLNMAEVLLRLSQFDDAQAALDQAMVYDPDSARAYMRLAEIHDQMGRIPDALDTIDKSIKLEPDMAGPIFRKAQILMTNNQVQDAVDILDDLLERFPKVWGAHQMRAEALVALNRNDEAEQTIRMIFDAGETLPANFFTLASIKKFTSEDDPDLLAMLAMQDRIDEYGMESKAVLNYALSYAHENLKKFDESFEYLKTANECNKKITTYTKATSPQAFAERYSPDLLEYYKGKGHQSETHVFIVGMPRSGTTLTEQILASHPDIYGAGELIEMNMISAEVRKSNTLDCEALGKQYLDMVQAYDESGEHKHITDKMPGNFAQIGLISMILPNAKIIHCRRNPIDTLLSCYKQNFARGQVWSYDLETLADEYERYSQIMTYWRKVLPGRMLEIDYEDTVSDLEGQARKMIEHIGLEWNDACLAPHKNKRAVITASKGQVTQPVYTSSVEKWRKYEKHLQPLVRRLLPDQALPEG